MRSPPLALLILPVALFAALFPAVAQNKSRGVWTEASDPTLPPDFKVQGE